MPLTRLCWVSPRWTGHPGGVRRAETAVIGELRRSGIEVLHAQADLPAGLPMERAAAQVDALLDRWWAAARPDLVHAEVPGLLAHQAIRRAAAAGIPATATWHQVHRHAPIGRQEAVRTLALDLLRRCQGVFCLTPAEAGRLAGEGVAGAVPLLAGVDVRRFAPGRRDPARRAARLVGAPGPLLLTACRLVPPKNLGLVAACARRLAASGVRWLVAGEGPERDRLTGIPGLELLGALPDTALAEAYADADLLVHPCPDEPLGLAVVEALASGTPVAAFSHGAAALVVRDGVHGALAPPGDDEGMIAAVAGLTGDPGRLAGMRAAAAAAVAGWTWPAVADRYLGLWTSLVP